MEEEVEEEAVDESIECTSEELKDEEAEAKPTPKPSADYSDSSFEAPHEPSADMATRAVDGSSVAGGSSVAALLQLRTGEHTAGVRSLRVACLRPYTLVA